MKKSERTINIVIEIALHIVSLVVIVPLLVVVLGAFKSPAEAIRYDLALPSKWYFSNFAEVIAKGNVLLAFKNSLIVTVSVVVVTTLCSALCSFIIARRNDSFSRFLNTFFSLGLIVPWSVVPTVVLLKTIGLQNTQAGLIFVLIATNISMSAMIITNFINTIPKDLDEAAALDGCGPLIMYFSVIFPLLKPVISTNVVITGMSAFNELQAPLYLLSSSKLTTLPLTVHNFKGRYFSEWNLIFANLMIVAIPMIILYLSCQRYVVSGMTTGAVKG